jgi:nicotinate-nucleotide adenylyltransferase
MSERRDLWIPALVAAAGLAVLGWDVAAGCVLAGVAAGALGLGAAGAVLALALRKARGRGASLGLSALLFLAALSPAFPSRRLALASFGLAALAGAVHPRNLPLSTRRTLLVGAGVLGLLAVLVLGGLAPVAKAAALPALAGAFAAALFAVTSRPRPEAPGPRGPVIAVFGGSFDPFHRAHRAIAEAVLKVANRLLVVVSARPPHKAGDREPTPFHHRVALARLGVEGLPRTEVLELENRREGPSYTVDTLDVLRKLNPPGTVFRLVLGGDSFHEFPLWHDWEGILERADLLVAARPGFDLEPPPEFEGRNVPVQRLDVDADPVSSSEVRRRVAAGESLGELVSPAVAAYVRDHGLYRGFAGGSEGAPAEGGETEPDPDLTRRAGAG